MDQKIVFIKWNLCTKKKNSKIFGFKDSEKQKQLGERGVLNS